MTIQQMIWRSSDADLLRDHARYREAITNQHFPEMIPYWKETVAMIEFELEQRAKRVAFQPYVFETPF